MSIEERLRRLLTDRHWTQKDLERASGVSQASISRVMTGRSTAPSAEMLIPLARALSVTVEELVTGRRPRSMNANQERRTWQAPKYLPVSDTSSPPKGFCKIPIIAGADVARYSANPKTEDIQGYILVAEDLIESSAQVIAFIVDGEDTSMFPVLSPGDTVFVDCSARKVSALIDQLCLCDINDEAVARFIRKTDNGYYLEMVNKEVERIAGPTLGKPGDFVLLGKIIGAWRLFR